MNMFLWSNDYEVCSQHHWICVQMWMKVSKSDSESAEPKPDPGFHLCSEPSRISVKFSVHVHNYTQIRCESDFHWEHERFDSVWVYLLERILQKSLLDHCFYFTSIHDIHMHFHILDSMALHHITYTLPNLCCPWVSNLYSTCVDNLEVWIELHCICWGWSLATFSVTRYMELINQKASITKELWLPKKVVWCKLACKFICHNFQSCQPLCVEC